MDITLVEGPQAWPKSLDWHHSCRQLAIAPKLTSRVRVAARYPQTSASGLGAMKMNTYCVAHEGPE